MGLGQWDFINNTKITEIVRVLADELEHSQKLLFLSRTPVVDVYNNDEIFARYKNPSYAADIVGLDQQTPVYTSGPEFEFVQNTAAKIKRAEQLTETDLTKAYALSQGDGRLADFFENWLMNRSDAMLRSIRERINHLIVSMHIDSFNYNRYDVDLRTVTWGMPAGLKATSGVTWDDTVNSTPISDLELMINDTAPDNFGERYDRITLGNKAFNYMIKSAEFRARYRGEIRYAFGANEINTADRPGLQQALASMLNCYIDVTTESFTEKNADGTSSRKTYLPDNKVIFGNVSNDNDPTAMDFANGIVPETIGGTLAGEPGFTGPQHGPIAYAKTSTHLDPATVTVYAAAYGWPRKKRATATAVLTVGTAGVGPWVG
jgi:hypothetical protein